MCSNTKTPPSPNNTTKTQQVELLIGRLANLPPFLPRPLRAANGILMGAAPHALESVLGFAFDYFDGGDYYARKREAQFRARHPGELFASSGLCVVVAVCLLLLSLLVCLIVYARCCTP